MRWKNIYRTYKRQYSTGRYLKWYKEKRTCRELDRALVALDAAEAHIDEITERLRQAELIKAEDKEGE